MGRFGSDLGNPALADKRLRKFPTSESARRAEGARRRRQGARGPRFLVGEKSRRGQDFNEGIELGAQGTPTLFLGGVALPPLPSYEELRDRIDAALAE